MAGMNPFDIKSVMLAKHAQHVVLIHFPIALFLVGVAFDVLAQRKKSEIMSGAARLNLVLAAVFAVPVVITGLLAWQWALGWPKLKGLLLEHLLLACTASVLMWIVGWIHFKAGNLPRYRFAIELVAAGLVMVTAHLGGFLSGVNLA